MTPEKFQDLQNQISVIKKEKRVAYNNYSYAEKIKITFNGLLDYLASKTNKVLTQQDYLDILEVMSEGDKSFPWGIAKYSKGDNSRIVFTINEILEKAPLFLTYTSTKGVLTDRSLCISERFLRGTFRAIRLNDGKNISASVTIGTVCLPDGTNGSSEILNKKDKNKEQPKDRLISTYYTNKDYDKACLKFSIDSDSFSKKLIRYNILSIILKQELEILDVKVDLDKIMNKSDFISFKSKVSCLVEEDANSYRIYREMIYERLVKLCREVAELTIIGNCGKLLEETTNTVVDGEIMLSAKLNYIATALTTCIIDKKEILSILFKELGDNDASYILDLIANTILYGYETDPTIIRTRQSFLNGNIRSNAKASNLVKSHDFNKAVIKIQKQITKLLFDRIAKTQEKVYLICDSTVVFTTARNMNKNELTNSKTEGFGYGLRVSMLLGPSGEPFYYENSNGSKNDTTIIKDIISELELRNIPPHKVHFVFDAGYYSAYNLLYLSRKGYQATILARQVSAIKEITKRVTIDDLLSSDLDESNEAAFSYIVPYKDYLSQTSITKFNNELPDLEITSQELESNHFNITIIYNNDVQRNKSEAYVTRLTKWYKELKQKLAETAGTKIKVAKHKVFEIEDGVIERSEDGSTCSINLERLLQVKHNLGFNVIISTDVDMSAQDAVALYSSRSDIEGQFRKDKQNANIFPVNVHSDEAYNLKLLVIMLASLVRNEITCKFKEEYTKDKTIDDHRKNILRKYHQRAEDILYKLHTCTQLTLLESGSVKLEKPNRLVNSSLAILGYSLQEIQQTIENSYSIRNQKFLREKDSKERKRLIKKLQKNGATPEEIEKEINAKESKKNRKSRSIKDQYCSDFLLQ